MQVDAGQIRLLQQLIAARLWLEGLDAVEVTGEPVAPETHIGAHVDGGAAAGHDSFEVFQLPFEVTELLAEAIGDGGVYGGE